MKENIPWKRFWVKADDVSIPDSLADGFLLHSDRLWGFKMADGPKEMSEILSNKCLILCGEPGMGKTRALMNARQSIEDAAHSGGICWKSFSDIFDPRQLLAELKGSQEWKDWVEHGTNLTVVIDGVDEGLALSIRVVRGLTSELRGKPIDRLQLILVCRDAEWPEEDGRNLMALWDESEVGKFQLQRLRAQDATQAAVAWGLTQPQADRFLQAVEAKAIESFACRPITLRMLVEEFREGHELPGTRSNIFARATKRLSREETERSKAIRQVTGYSFGVDEVIEFAQRVAALLMLGRFSAVSYQPTENKSEFHLYYESLIPTLQDERERRKVEFTLGTALFCDAGEQVRMFSHRSFAEFLAAKYLARLRKEQLLDLLCIHAEGNRVLVPQLAELAAWLALEHDEFLDWVLTNEPEVILRNDASCLSEEKREQLVDGLLKRMANEEVFDDWDLKRFYGSLRHKDLSNQLLQYLKDKNANWIVRRAAIRLADLGGMIEVVDELIEIAKDQSQQQSLREHAFRTVCKLMPQERLSELEVFAKGEAGVDPDGDMRATALKTLVPAHWPVSKAIPQLLTPVSEDYIGAFHLLCEGHLPNSIDASDLRAILDALNQIENPFQGHRNRFRSIAYRTVSLCLRHLNDSNIGKLFANLILDKLGTGQLPIGFNDENREDTQQEDVSVRKRIWELFIDEESVDSESTKLLLFRPFFSVQNEDWPWIHEKLLNSHDEKHKSWSRLASWLWPGIVETEFRDSFFTACEEVPRLGSYLNWPQSIVVGSDEARMLKKRCSHTRKNEEENRKTGPKPTNDEIFVQALSEASDSYAGWRRLAWELQKEQNERLPSGASPDPEKQYRWSVCSQDQRDQMVDCAVSFLMNAELSPQRKELSTLEEILLHEFWALWLARTRLSEDLDLKRKLFDEQFEVFFAPPFESLEAQELIALAVKYDDLHSCECIKMRLEFARDHNRSLSRLLSLFELVWFPELTITVLDFINQNEIEAGQLFQVLEVVERHDNTAVQCWLRSNLASGEEKINPSMLGMGILLDSEWTIEEWGRMWQSDGDLRRSTLQHVANYFFSSTLGLAHLTVDQLGQLYCDLETSFPTDKPFKVKSEEKEDREHVEKLRNSIPMQLSKLGTQGACDAMLRMANAIPHMRIHLKWQLRALKHSVLNSHWAGVPLDVLHDLFSKGERRWVTSDDDLLELICESLERLQIQINQSEQPLSRHFWNESPISPKEEEVLSEEVARWLREDLSKNGVAVSCEVQPTKVHRTDIEVFAKPSGSRPSGERFVVTIEVKRHDNKEVCTSLEEQLIAEYLLKLSRTHGIYLVGWYSHSHWRPNRNPTKAKTWEDCLAAVESLRDDSRRNHPGLSIEAVCLNCEFPEAFRKT